ncbi:MAG: aminopeptidase P N-terminal domain-containing protein [Candidatus Edwardsbacteria bacterium]|nr:aminopeptidase P N-terminal domain-containing protein [Candidatus Edwardsbacteria bacterium]
MKHTLPPSAFFQRNRDAFVAQMKPAGAAVFRAAPKARKNADEDHKYEPDSDFFYLTGIEAPLAALILFPNSPRSKQTLFIEKPEPQIEQWTGKRMTEEEAKGQSGCEVVGFIEHFEHALGSVLAAVENVYLNYRPVPLKAPLNDDLQFVNAIRERFPHLNIVRANALIAQQRLAKAPEEIDRLKKAIEITGIGLAAAMKAARPGVHEFELQSAIEKAYLDNRSDDVGFLTIVASGVNACTLHYETNECEMKDGDLALIDTGADYCHYTADITRTFPVSGTFTARQKEVYQKVLDAQKKTIELIKPGITLLELNNQTREMLITACKNIGLKKEKYEEYYAYVKHGVSHHLGLDAHDVSDLKEAPLAPGQVITVEPGLYIAEESIGIRIEDDVLVTESGCEVLSKDIPKEIAEIEALMRR